MLHNSGGVEVHYDQDGEAHYARVVIHHNGQSHKFFITDASKKVVRDRVQTVLVAELTRIATGQFDAPQQ